MFAGRTKVLVKNLGAEGDLIYNENVNETIRMLTLVKVRQKTFWPIIRYSIIDQTLFDLLEEADVSPEYKEEVLMEDFENLRGRCGRGSAVVKAQEAEVSLNRNVDVVDGASSFTLKKKTVDIEKLRKSSTNKKLNKKMVDMLKLKPTEKLAFVYQIVYNTNRVDFFVKVGEEGSVTAAFKTFFKLNVSDSKKEETKFTVPQESTFAYGLMEITTEDGILGIPPRTRKVRQYNKGWWNISSDGDDEDFCQTLRQVKTEIKSKEHLLQPLEDLPESTRRHLLKTLVQILEDRRALTLLEQTLDQDSTGASNRPQSQAVSSFMDLLEPSNVSTSQKDAVHLLVSAMDTLPDDVAALLTSCCPDTLRVLNQLVDGLKEDGDTKLPESLPPPLQEDGELRWTAELLCSTNQTLRELSDQWDSPELPAGVLLEVLSVVVRGLSLMQPTTD
ncbi:gasdermin-E-like isoform X3 [Anabas testudineus]|uniref:Gasdermin pore forming domain-containing protein n=1 Tax=Anabas testudineus TaxID=64144 RepID=A0AAQ6IKH7_ANATE|nr:gasdermin-E-like isoform X3 [Anabas testudineus]